MQKAYRMNSGKSSFVNAKMVLFFAQEKAETEAEISGFKPHTD